MRGEGRAGGGRTKLDTPRCQKFLSKIYAMDWKCRFSQTLPFLSHLIVFLMHITILLLVAIYQGQPTVYRLTFPSLHFGKGATPPHSHHHHHTETKKT